MKNEHIHGLDKKLLNLETVVGLERGADGFCSLRLPSTPEYHPEIAAETEPGSFLGVWRGRGRSRRSQHAAIEMVPQWMGGIGGLGGNEELAVGTSSPLLTPALPLQAERNLLLEEKLKTLQQENEDLQARTQNHLVMTR